MCFNFFAAAYAWYVSAAVALVVYPRTHAFVQGHVLRCAFYGFAWCVPAYPYFMGTCLDVPAGVQLRRKLEDTPNMSESEQAEYLEAVLSSEVRRGNHSEYVRCSSKAE
eukprot:1161775-Pelagomonas_calceolata.AAC.3